jgi:broad-specificity NMP kinase
MKKLIMINGTMGVGKSTVCNILLNKLNPSVYLDGDWCWNMNPFVVSEENKEMVINNISYLLKSYLNNSGYKYIIFCWVIQEDYIFKQILDKLNSFDFELHKISLVCTEEALKSRLNIDVQNGIRKADVISRSIERISFYEKMDTFKIDVSNITPEDTAKQICTMVQ